MANKPAHPNLSHATLLDDADRLLAGASIVIPKGRPNAPAPALIIDERRLLAAALEEPYEGNDPARMGLSKLAATAKSVATQAADGIPWAVDFIFNRLYGRPKQTVQAVNLNMSLKEYLAQLAENPEANPLADTPAPSHNDAQEAEIVL